MNSRQTNVYKYARAQALLCDSFKGAEIVDNGIQFSGAFDEEVVVYGDTFAEVAQALHNHCSEVPLASREWRRVMTIAVRKGN
jgi:hypothetical protein